MPVSLVEKEPAPPPFPTKSAFLPAFSCAFAGAAENGGQPNCCRAILGSPSVVDPGHTHRGFLGFGEGRASRGAQWHTEKLGMACAMGRSGFCQGVSQEGKCDIIQGLCHIICLSLLIDHEMLSLQAARALPPSSHPNLLFSPFACARQHQLCAQQSQSKDAASTAAERDTPQCPFTSHFLNTNYFLLAGSLCLHLFSEIKCAVDGFLVIRLSITGWLVCTLITSPHSEPPHFCKLVMQTAMSCCPIPV